MLSVGFDCKNAQLRFLGVFGLILATNSVYATCVGLSCLCLVTAIPVSFGALNPLSGSPYTSTGNIAVTCTVLSGGMDVSYQIALGAGLNGSFAARKMALLRSMLEYNLYTSLTYTNVWGDGSSGTSTVSDSYNLNVLLETRNYPVYGSIPSSQAITPGIYADIVNVTVTY